MRLRLGRQHRYRSRALRGKIAAAGMTAATVADEIAADVTVQKARVTGVVGIAAHKPRPGFLVALRLRSACTRWTAAVTRRSRRRTGRSPSLPRRLSRSFFLASRFRSIAQVPANLQRVLAWRLRPHRQSSLRFREPGTGGQFCPVRRSGLVRIPATPSRAGLIGVRIVDRAGMTGADEMIAGAGTTVAAGEIATTGIGARDRIARALRLVLLSSLSSSSPRITRRLQPRMSLQR